jgi:hypothetical protein
MMHRGPGRGPMRRGMMKDEKASDFKGTMIKLIGYLGKYKATNRFDRLYLHWSHRSHHPQPVSNLRAVRLHSGLDHGRRCH